MRRSTLGLSSSLVAIGLSASIALAQQSSRPAVSAPASGVAPAATAADDTIDPSMASRPTRYLLRNGLDYLAYREYARALSFFRIVESRQAELNELELKQLKSGIARAQQGLREAVNGTKVVAQTKGRPAVQPGAFALARPAKAPTDPVQLASAEMPTPPTTAPAGVPDLPPAIPAPGDLTDPIRTPGVVSTRPVFGGGATRPAPEFGPEPAPAVAAATPSAADPMALPAQASSPAELPPSLPPAGPAATEPPPMALEPSSPSPSPSPSPLSSPVELPPTIPSSTDLPPTVSPPVPMTAEPMPAPVEPAPVEPAQPRAAVARRPDEPAAASSTTPREPLPAPEAPPAPEAGPTSANPPEGILTPRLYQEALRVAQRTNPDQNMPGTAVDPFQAPPPSQGSTRLELPRAPSPTEARPLRQIHVPEEYVNLGPRKWDPNRKYWAAAGTCHMILYFQDPVLERYGQSAEQALGPIGRYFSYPLDDPKQSNQRNQILQPFYSMGKFCFQVGTLPYKLVVDPPWEAEYDLGYYRPGDRIPPDTIMITPYGVGPPLKGRQY